MIGFLRRLRWQDLTIRAKFGLIFGGQAIIIVFLGLAGFLALRSVETETTNVFNTSLALHERVQNLMTDLDELRGLAENIMPAYYDSAYYARAASITARHQELVQEEMQGETEAILSAAAGLDPGLRVQVEGSVNALRLAGQRADERASQAFAIATELADPENGRLVELDTHTQSLQALVLSQDNAALTQTFLHMRHQEAIYIVSRNRNDLQSLRNAIAACRQAYREIPTAERVSGIDASLDDYEAILDEIAAMLVDFEGQFYDANNYYDQMARAIAELNDVAGRRFGGGLETIDRVQALATTVVSVGAAIAMLIGAGITFTFGRDILRSTQRLLEVTGRVQEGDLSARAIVRGKDEFNQLAENFNATAVQLEELVGGLEKRVLERTRDLTLTAEISHSIAELRDPDTLMSGVVELIRRNFGFYHAQVFLVDPSRHDAELVASTGEAGLALLARKHSLPVGSRSVIGQVTATGEPVIASDTSADPVHRRNELLPDTRSEMALPMRVGERVVGALDVQSVEPDAFTQESIAVLQIVADQLGIANQNAQLFAQTQRALTEIEALNRRLLGRAWLSHIQRLHDQEVALAYRLQEEEIEPHRDGSVPLLDQAIHTGRLVMIPGTGKDDLNLAVPIKVRGEVIGAFGFGGDSLRDPTDEELTLIQAVVDRVGLALENMRLFEETQRLAQREHLVNEITAKIVGSTDVSTILQTTVKELGRVLRAPQVSVQLHRESSGDEREEE